jgi:hypothetical protein
MEVVITIPIKAIPFIVVIVKNNKLSLTMTAITSSLKPKPGGVKASGIILA